MADFLPKLELFLFRLPSRFPRSRFHKNLFFKMNFFQELARLRFQKLQLKRFLGHPYIKYSGACSIVLYLDLNDAAENTNYTDKPSTFQPIN